MSWLLTLPFAYAEEPETTDTDDVEEEVVVYADLRQRPDQALPTSTTVIDAATIRRRGATHLEEVLNTAPNVNFSSGTSRARFFQIRGIGERSQFIEPLNPAVGLIVDGIDLTGLGTVAGLTDVAQVEVLRGPQGTLYGANALAGLINITTTDPGDTWAAEAMVGAGNYSTLEARGRVDMPLADGVGLRLAAGWLQSDGFVENTHLDRDDTQGRQELTVRGKLVWDLSDDLQARVTGFHADTSNGYDAFNFDNDRTTQSDEPGRDEQATTGLGVDLRWSSPKVRLEARSSLALSDVLYSFDEDWTFDSYHPDGYTSKDAYIRDVTALVTDVRALSGDEGALFGGRTTWVAGFFTYDRTEDLRREYTFAEADFTSTNRIARQALYGETTTTLDVPVSFTLGLRGERQRVDYVDSNDVAGEPGEWLWGGKASVDYALPQGTVYALASRGYNAGGLNAAPSLPDELRAFRTESLWNLEVGAKTRWLDGRSRVKVAAFYQARAQVQTSGAFTLQRDDGSTEFIQYTTNDDRGRGIGLEGEADLAIGRYVKAYGSVGLLDAVVSSDDDTVDGRKQPHAPLYMGLVGVRADVDVVFGGVALEGKDSFFFSTRHDATSRAYALLNAHLGVRVKDTLELMLWGRNLTNTVTYTRGFGAFGNDPANGYETEPYYQLGEPRVFGARLTGRM